MSRRPFSCWFRVAALVLFGAGAGFLLIGVIVFLSSGKLAFIKRTQETATAAATATPEPTATEPILPPPPTRTRTATRQPATRAIGLATPIPTSTALTTAVPGQVTTLSPTLTASAMPTISQTATRLPAPTLSLSPSPPSTVPPPSPTVAEKGLFSLRQRMGVAGGDHRVNQALAAEMGLGWYLDWKASTGSFQLGDVEYMPMIRLKAGEPVPSGQALLDAVDALPGALWLIGNEPDVKWQDNVPPDRYADLYHDLYAQLKALDPTCQVAIGGVSQPTPLRLRYLDRILEAYQDRYGEPMPVDVWNVHNFILREELDVWGVDIPPGMTEKAGVLREVVDHDDLPIFRQQIVDFRRWMKERGQRDKPLIVTEYGILMPAEYGFPLENVRHFMVGTFEFFRTATDPSLGYPADEDRLVQRWCWFSLADERYPTGNLVGTDGGELTLLGEAFRTYANGSR